MSSDPTKQNAGYELVKPPRDLRAKVRGPDRARGSPVRPHQVAEAALERLSHDFDDWMASESATLSDAWTDIQEKGIGDTERRENPVPCGA